jgi:uncharacterized alpha/beta hydrolase family protein
MNKKEVLKIVILLVGIFISTTWILLSIISERTGDDQPCLYRKYTDKVEVLCYE